jgi:hypothetical protein
VSEIRPPEGAQASASTRLAAWVWYAGAVLAFWRGGYTPMRGSDLWWHLASGRWIFENRQIPIEDPFSFTATKAWVVDAWLSDLVLYLWSRAFGEQSLVYWKWLVVVATFLILMRLLKRLSGSHLAAYLAATCALIGASPFLDIRPQIQSLLCYAILLDLCVARERLSWWVVPLLLVWVNLHPGFALGLLMLPILSIPFLLKPDQRYRTVRILGACVLVCLVNPNGIHALSQPILYSLPGASMFKTIKEWSPPFTETPGGIESPFYPYLIALFTSSVAVHAILKFRAQSDAKARPAAAIAILMGALALAMSLKSRRFVSVFAITQSLIVAMAFGPALRAATAKTPPLILPVGAFALGVCLLWPYPQRTYAFHYLVGESSFPVEVVNFIELNEVSGRVFTDYGWGGYLHHRTRGTMSVYIDGRANAVFDEETYLNYRKVYSRLPGWEAIVEGSGADFFLWPITEVDQAKLLLKTGRWRILYGDAVSILLVRKTVDRLGDRTPTPESAAKNFARGEAARKKGRLAEAIGFFERALEFESHHEGACKMLSIAERQLGNETRSLEVLERCYEIFPRYADEPHNR